MPHREPGVGEVSTSPPEYDAVSAPSPSCTGQLESGRIIDAFRSASSRQVTLSVLIPNYNTSAFVGDAITSVLAQMRGERAGAWRKGI